MKSAFLLFVVLLLLPPPARGETETVRSLSLKQAIAMALDNNHRVRSAALNARASTQLEGIASSRLFPRLSFRESLDASNSPTHTFMMKLDQGRFTQNDFLIHNLNHPDTWRNFTTSLTLTQTLYDPSISPGREMARQESGMARAGFEGARQEIAFRVFLLHLEGVRAVARVRAVEQAMLEAEETVRLAAVRQREGVGLRSDLLRAETHRAMVEQQLISARNAVTLARMRMAVAVGAEEGSLVEVRESGVALRSFSPAELLRMAGEERSELQHAGAERDRGRAALRLARGAYLPTLEGLASYRLDSREHPFGADNDAWAAGVSLNWNIFDGLRRERELKRAGLGLSVAEEQLVAIRSEVMLQVRESLLHRDEAEQQLRVSQSSVTAADETVRLLSRRFENSLATMVELLDAQSALNQARFRLVEAESDCAASAGRVLHSAGIFLKEIMR